MVSIFVHLLRRKNASTNTYPSVDHIFDNREVLDSLLVGWVEWWKKGGGGLSGYGVGVVLAKCRVGWRLFGEGGMRRCWVGGG